MSYEVNSSASDPRALDADQRAKLVRDHFEYVWRLLRRLGLCPSDADDAVQEVFLVGVQKAEQIEPGRERSFLYGCALNKARRIRSVRRRVSETTIDSQFLAGTLPGVDELLDHRKAALVLDRLLESLGEEQRSVFVLFEIEQLTLDEVAALLQIPRGTAASRLRLARARVQALLAVWSQVPAVEPGLAAHAANREGTFSVSDRLIQSLRGTP